MVSDSGNALRRALLALDGLSVGDAFGERFFGDPKDALDRISARQLPGAPWSWTDDSEMACALTEHLAEYGTVKQEELAGLFSERMTVGRGYGMSAYDILMGIRDGQSWRSLSFGAFRGKGSFGNGAAMRVAPLGAFFADEEDRVIVEQARLSAEVTHTHLEGIAGAIAVALGTAFACRRGAAGERTLDRAWAEEVCAHLPAGYTRDGIAEALSMSDATVFEVAERLGNGSGVTSPDTLPLCFWVAARYTGDFEESMWTTVSALGDRDTTCAIVGGMVAPLLGREALPHTWLDAREALPESTAALSG